MADAAENKEYNLYRDIRNRTNGEVYLGVVGPVRTGKSTFIRRFMELLVLPFMEDEQEKKRALDELPQAAAGKTVMTTEPKFIPKQAASIRVQGESAGEAAPVVKVRLVDCVGFLVDGASGYLEDGGKRMVKTPWFPEEIPFEEAAAFGTQKVIKEHATIGIVVTTDGTIGELLREDYAAAEERTVKELKTSGKPFVILLNSTRPYAKETEELAGQLSEKYKTTVIPVSCEQLRREDVAKIMEGILGEFPVERVEFYIPKWTEMLPIDHPVKKRLIEHAAEILGKFNRAVDVGKMEYQTDEIVTKVKTERMSLSEGIARVSMEVSEACYYENMSEMTGVTIQSEYELISLVRELAAKKEAYEKVASAFELVQAKGYSVVNPELSDIKMEEPVLIRHGNKFGVKMRAVSPSIHMIRANIETEIAPIVGSEEQANDLIHYIEEGQQSSRGVWDTNIFGKTVGELMEDGIRSKIAMMDDECQMKLQDTMQKIVNDNNGGMVCIII